MKNKKIIIGMLCFALVFMGIGFALFSTSLNINGTATASGSFDVKITNVTQNSKSAGTVNTTLEVGNNYAVTEQDLSAVFSEPGDYIIYDITVTNRGSIDAVFSVGVYPQTSTSGAFEMKCNAHEGTSLAPGASTTFQCEINFDKNYQLSSIENIAQGSMQIVITAVQGSEYESPTPTIANKCFLSFREGEINGYLINDPDCSANLVIPDNLTLGIREITSIEFSDAKCSQFESGLVNLDSSYTCTNLKAQFNSLKSNPANVFSSFLGALTTVTYGDEGKEKFPVTKIGDGVFAGMQLTGVSFGEGIETIGLASFVFNNLTSVTFPSTLKVIGVSSFFSNRLSGTLTIPASVISINQGAFEGNTDNASNQISSIVFEKGSHLQTIGNFAFEENRLTGTLIIPASVETIGYSAFNGTKDNQPLATNQITTLLFESGSHLRSIGDAAFRDNNIMGTLRLPTNLTTIEKNAFLNNSINTLYLGSGIANIEYYAFYMKNSTDLNDVYVDMTETNWNNNVSKSSTLFNGSPTIHFNQ